MKTASVRDLRYHFSRVEHLLRDGEEIQITKRKRVIARLIPNRSSVTRLQHRPNFLLRLQKLFGHQLLKTSGAQRLSEERGRF